jgi:ribosomal protein L11 methylase PrmA
MTADSPGGRGAPGKDPPDQSSHGSRASSSFRDPSGFLFHRDGVLYRQINRYYEADWNLLRTSGLLAALHDSGDLVRHEEIEIAPADAARALCVIRPELIPFISHPYEWCFGQLKDAALLTLRIHRAALERGMMLKDASAYNVQFVGARAVFIDTLSFARREEGAAWPAYRQFCRHFLAPLALMATRDPSLNSLLRLHLDGVPLELASRLLPMRTRVSPRLLTHIHLHAAGEKRFAEAGEARATTPGGARSLAMSQNALLGLVESLEAAIRNLDWKPGGTFWADYDGTASYSDSSLDEKAKTVEAWLARLRPKSLWDVGANTGRFGRLAPRGTELVVSWDGDPSAVERNYQQAKEEKDTRILPLIVDLANPSPGSGWMHEERQSFLDRGPADAVLALALVHHLALGNNLPLPDVARFFRALAPRLIIEFVPASDKQAKGLMIGREAVFPDYREDAFGRAFEAYYQIVERRPVPGSERALFLMEARDLGPRIS